MYFNAWDEDELDLLDDFAGAALPEALRRETVSDEAGTQERAARIAYQVAEQMLHTRRLARKENDRRRRVELGLEDPIPTSPSDVSLSAAPR